eukprot:gnl/TRDRNA2_/TRDRNA2_31199_c0_seq1.p1 gnl/TRDRNA2_/TRDRNA2_31199_c0~~gnl/TRDRNA2_/TRDRNA2_31199_c0_seq1.p1  ORF type:complete len:251 (-),score=42.49 gnl/TRDRNA2_/TRDRNA2_31199_c0_seq1:119-763(-)
MMGMMVWGASFVMAEFLSRHSKLVQIQEVKELMEGTGTLWESWEGKSGLELGAGLGLPSIVVSNLGARMIATDGDEVVLQLLKKNAERNAPQCRVEKLRWGSADPLTMLGLKQDLDFVLATEVLFGDNLEQWSALVETIKMVSGSNTLVLISNHANHFQSTGMDGALYKMLDQHFEVKLLSQSLLHPSFRKNGDESCFLYALRKRNRVLSGPPS